MARPRQAMRAYAILWLLLCQGGAERTGSVDDVLTDDIFENAQSKAAVLNKEIEDLQRALEQKVNEREALHETNGNIEMKTIANIGKDSFEKELSPNDATVSRHEPSLLELDAGNMQNLTYLESLTAPDISVFQSVGGGKRDKFCYGVNKANDGIGNGANIAGAVTTGATSGASGAVAGACTAAAPYLVGVGAVVGGGTAWLQGKNRDKMLEIMRAEQAKAGARLTEDDVKLFKAAEKCIIHGTKDDQFVTLTSAGVGTAAGCVCLAFPPAWPVGLVAGLGILFANYLRDSQGVNGINACDQLLAAINKILMEHGLAAEEERILKATMGDWSPDHPYVGWVPEE